MTVLKGRRIVLGVSGGIAAYKAAELVRLLVNAGADAGRTDVDGQTAAVLARAAGHGALADWIEQRAGQQR